jgi:HlyD family secretion protein
MGGKVKVVVLLLVLGAGAALGYVYLMREHAGEDGAVRVSGNIEITDADVSFKIPGHVEERLVSEGEMVEAGQIVATLDTEDLAHEVDLRRAEVRASSAALDELLAGSRPEEIAQAMAAVEQAQARLDELLAGSRPQEVAEAEAAVEAANAAARRTASDYARLKALHESGAVTDSQFAAITAADDTARAELRRAREKLALVREGPRKEEIQQARAALLQARERYGLVQAGPRAETIEQARASLQQAQAALALAETRLGYGTLRAPLTGLVLTEDVEAGEYVAPGTPVVTVGDLENVWVRAYINETDLGRVKVGQQAEVTTDTYPGKAYRGTVTFISSEAEFTPKNVQTKEQRVKLVYRIKVTIPNPNMELKPGMPADAEILVAEGRSDERDPD